MADNQFDMDYVTDEELEALRKRRELKREIKALEPQAPERMRKAGLLGQYKSRLFSVPVVL